MSEWEFVYPGEAVVRVDHEDGAYDFMSCVLYCGINAGGVMVFKLIRECEDANTKTNHRRTEDTFYHNPMFDAVTTKFLGDEYQMYLVSAIENPVRVLKIRKVKQD